MKDRFNNAIGPHARSGQNRPGRMIPVLALFVMLGSLQASTQFFAHVFLYHEALGLNFHRIYAPWMIVLWAQKWYAAYPEAFVRSGSIGIVCAALGLGSLAIARIIAANSSKTNRYLHGSARWANIDDIRAAGLLRPWRFPDIWRAPQVGAGSEVYVGAWVDRSGTQHYLRHSGPEHVLCYAPTRSGKGVGLIVPTLLSWSPSAVITDLKGELWALTAGWRQQHAGNKVLRFEPAAAVGSLCWNPLDEIRLGTEHEVGDVQNLATLIVDPDGKGLENHWQKTAQALLVGVILHALYRSAVDKTAATLPAIDAILSDPDRSIGELWMEMVTTGHVDGKPHPVIASAARDMMDRPDEEAGSVLSTAKSYLALYRDPIVARNVSCSEFKVHDLMHHENAVSLYIVTQPNDKTRLRPLVRVLVNMIVRLLADKMEFQNGRPVAHYRHRLLLMLDEFPSLGRLDILQESLAFIAGYGIKCYIICQDINQLKSRESGYGPDESITSNCHVQNAFPPNRIETAEYLSRLSGQTTVIKEQITTSGRRTSALHQQVSRTTQEVQRALLTPDECLRMPGPTKTASGDITEAGDMVVYVAGHPAIYGRQPLYFQDPVFRARVCIAPPKVSDRLRTQTAAAAAPDEIIL